MKKAAKEYRENGTTIRFKPEERAVLERVAQYNGEMLSTYIRRVVLSSARAMVREIDRDEGLSSPTRGRGA